MNLFYPKKKEIAYNLWKNIFFILKIWQRSFSIYLFIVAAVWVLMVLNWMLPFSFTCSCLYEDWAQQSTG